MLQLNHSANDRVYQAMIAYARALGTLAGAVRSVAHDMRSGMPDWATVDGIAERLTAAVRQAESVLLVKEEEQ